MYESFRLKNQVLNLEKHTNNSRQTQVAQTIKDYLHRNVFKNKKISRIIVMNLLHYQSYSILKKQCEKRFFGQC